MNFAGLQVTASNVKPSEKLLESIRNFPTPKDITGARAWFGLVNQGAYAFAMTSEMAPFRHLLQPKTKFEWTEGLDSLFHKSKEAIVNKIIEGVSLFDPTLTTCLATDFSAHGIGYFLLQKTCQCSARCPTCCKTGWRLCLVGSRFLRPAETRYAPIEGEALAVAYALHQCRYFVLGCKDLIVATDHKPLLSVLNDRSLADIHNRRLQNIKEKTLSYRFTMCHVPGKKHLGPDAASRYPVSQAEALDLPGEPTETEFEDAPTTTAIRADILEGLASVEDDDLDDTFLIQEACSHLASICMSSGAPISQLQQTHNLASASQPPLVITWAEVQAASAKDTTTQEMFALLKAGFPSDARSLSADTRPYFPYSTAMYELDGVLMMSDRIVVPTSLRNSILQLLHAAHQGIDRMKARAAEAVFWPGIVGDIAKTRWGCLDCHKMAPSNPTQPPTAPPDPEYPFQYLAADYFHHLGKYYLVVVDRYSHWPSVYSSPFGSKGLITSIRQMFSTFGIPEELASDGGVELTAKDTENFLQAWGVHHRVSSVAFPHSNCRAELAVKQVKRIITSNCSPSGSLDVDKFHKAILSYRNTPDPVTKFSPAMAVFGREMRDGMPVLPGRYNPHACWKELLEHREKGLAKRHVAMREAWNEHTTKLVPLSNGDKVFLQNQRGNNPRRWDRTGTILESKQHDQYLVKVDGTGRTSLRNRKFLRKYQPIAKPSSAQQIPSIPVPEQMPSLQPAAARPGTRTTPTHSTPPAPYILPAPETPALKTPVMPASNTQAKCEPTQEPLHRHHEEFDHVLEPSLSYPSVQAETPTPPEHPSYTPPTRVPGPPSPPPVCVSPPATRPSRATKPSSKLDPAVWDLSSLSQCDMVPMEMYLGLIKWVAANADRLSQSPLDKKTPVGEGDKGY